MDRLDSRPQVSGMMTARKPYPSDVSDEEWALAVPANLTLIHPPPYSPELNPVERVWEYLRDRWLSHRVLAGGYEAVVDAACAAWNALVAEPGRLRSLTNFPWLPASVTTS